MIKFSLTCCCFCCFASSSSLAFSCNFSIYPFSYLKSFSFCLFTHFEDAADDADAIDTEHLPDLATSGPCSSNYSTHFHPMLPSTVSLFSLFLVLSLFILVFFRLITSLAPTPVSPGHTFRSLRAETSSTLEVITIFLKTSFGTSNVVSGGVLWGVPFTHCVKNTLVDSCRLP